MTKKNRTRSTPTTALSSSRFRDKRLQLLGQHMGSGMCDCSDLSLNERCNTVRSNTPGMCLHAGLCTCIHACLGTPLHKLKQLPPHHLLVCTSRLRQHFALRASDRQRRQLGYPGVSRRRTDPMVHASLIFVPSMHPPARPPRPRPPALGMVWHWSAADQGRLVT